LIDEVTATLPVLISAKKVMLSSAL